MAADSPSPLLRLNLMGTGNDAGSWGTNTNNNLQIVLENAIAGYQAVSITSASQALTASNSSSIDQARAALLKITGSTGTATLYAPPVSKQYVIYNTLSGNLTISNATANNGTTATGGSTVVIPTGTIVTVWSDGTNFFSQNTFLPGTVALGNPLTIANGGTGATTAAGALTNLGVVSASLQAVYPVGSIYMNASNSTSPATLFGFGIWTALAAGRMLLGNGGGYSAGGTGGSSTTALSTTNLPSHTHGSSGLSASSSSNSSASTSVNISDPGHNHTYTFKTTTGGTLAGGDPNSVGNVTVNTGNAVTGISASASTSVTTNTSTSISGSTDATGSGSAFTTISPYLVVYMWQRTA